MGQLICGIIAIVIAGVMPVSSDIQSERGKHSFKIYFIILLAVFGAMLVCYSPQVDPHIRDFIKWFGEFVTDGWSDGSAAYGY